MRSIGRLSEDFTHNGERRGRTGQRQAVEAFLRGFPDLHNEIAFMLAEGDLVRLTRSGAARTAASSSAWTRRARR